MRYLSASFNQNGSDILVLIVPSESCLPLLRKCCGQHLQREIPGSTQCSATEEPLLVVTQYFSAFPSLALTLSSKIVLTRVLSKSRMKWIFSLQETANSQLHKINVHATRGKCRFGSMACHVLTLYNQRCNAKFYSGGYTAVTVDTASYAITTGSCSTANLY